MKNIASIFSLAAVAFVLTGCCSSWDSCCNDPCPRPCMPKPCCEEKPKCCPKPHCWGNEMCDPSVYQLD